VAEATDARKAVAEKLPLLCAIALVAPSCFDAIAETDAGFHIVVGRDILAGSLPHVNGHSWVAMQQPWFSTYWLFDAICALLDKWFGPLGLQLLTFAMAVATLWLLAKLLGKGAWLLPALAVLLEPRLRARPHCMTWIAIELVLLAGLSKRRWPALIAIAVDANLHAGAAFAAAISGLFFLEAYLEKRKRSDLAGLALSPLVLLVNPNGWLNVRYLFAHLDVGALVPLREFAPPSWPQSSAFVAAAIIAIAMALRAPREKAALLAAVLIFAGLGVFAARMQWEFFLVASPLLGEALALVDAKLRHRTALLAAFAAFGLCVLQIGYLRRLLILDPGPKFDASVLPVRVARYIQDQKLSGHYFNSYDDGGYLMYALPTEPVFLDGRLHAYPASLYEELARASQKPEDFDNYLRALTVEWAVIQRRAAATTGQGLLDSRPGWALVYWDDINELYVRRDVPRWADLVKRQELHQLFPTGVRPGPRENLKSEIDRLLRYSPDDPLLISARSFVAP
jgi:hypothetical protein